MPLRVYIPAPPVIFPSLDLTTGPPIMGTAIEALDLHSVLVHSLWGLRHVSRGADESNQQQRRVLTHRPQEGHSHARLADIGPVYGCPVKLKMSRPLGPVGVGSEHLPLG